VGAASRSITAQVVALFPILSEITPAKIPPTHTHKHIDTVCLHSYAVGRTKRDVSQTSQDGEDIVWSVMGVVRHNTFFFKKATDKCSQMCVNQLLMPTPNTKTKKTKTLHTNNATHIK